MALVHHQEEVLGEEVDQAEGPVPRLAVSEVQRVVLDPVAEAHLLKHLEVVVRAHLDALRLEVFPLLLEPGDPLLELRLDGRDRRGERAAAPHVLVRRVEVELLKLADLVPGQGVELAQRVDRVAEEFDAQSVLHVGRHHVDHVAAHPETPGLQLVVVAVVDVVDQPLKERIPPEFRARPDRDPELGEVLGRAEPVDAGDARDDDHVAPAHQGARRRKPEALDLLVDRGVLLDVGVARGDVGLRLVEVVVADEVLDGVLREERLELREKLGRQGLVVADDEDRPLAARDDVGHREGLAGAGHAEERLVPVPRAYRADKRLDRLGLVAGRLVVGAELKKHGQWL